MLNISTSLPTFNIKCVNNLNKPKQFTLFGAGYNSKEDVVSTMPGVSYDFMQKQLLSKNYWIGMMYLQVTQSKLPASKVLSALQFFIDSKDVSGQRNILPINMGVHFPKINQVNMDVAEVHRVFNLNIQTSIQFTLPAKTTLEFTFYRSALEELFKIKGIPFVNSLIDRIQIIQSKTRKYEYYINGKHTTDNESYANFVNAGNQLLTRKIERINDVPADIYRNLCELSVVIDEYEKTLFKYGEAELIKKAQTLKKPTKKTTKKRKNAKA